MYKNINVITLVSLCVLSGCATWSNDAPSERVIPGKEFRDNYEKDMDNYDILPIDLKSVNNSNPSIVKENTNNVYVVQEVKDKIDVIHVSFDKKRELKHALFLLIEDLEANQERYKHLTSEKHQEALESAIKDMKKLYESEEAIEKGLVEISKKHPSLKKDFSSLLSFYDTVELKQDYGLVKIRIKYDYNYDEIKLNLLKYEFQLKEFAYKKKDIAVVLPETRLKMFVYPYQFSQDDSKCEYALDRIDLLDRKQEYFVKYIFCSNARIHDVKDFVKDLK